MRGRESAAATPRPAQTPASSAVRVGCGTSVMSASTVRPAVLGKRRGERLAPERRDASVRGRLDRLGRWRLEARARVVEEQERDADHARDERKQRRRARCTGEPRRDEEQRPPARA